MVSLGHLFIFANLGKVSCLQFCSFLTENGWVSVDPANWICFKYYTEPSSWWDAKRSCEQQGLFLARPDNEGINEFIARELPNWKQRVWIGGINHEDSVWKWTNGDEMDFTNFKPLSRARNWIRSFFKKSASCAKYQPDLLPFKWEMGSCDDLEPYVCQSGRNTTLARMDINHWLLRTRFSDSSTKFCEPDFRQESVKSNSAETACYVFFEKRSSWWDADESCREQNMSLVTVSDVFIDGRLADIRNLLAIDFWIGVINKGNTGWKWENGEDMVYTNFDSFHVTWDRIFKQTLCGVRGMFGWYKYSCDNLYPFICQFYSHSTTALSKPVEIHEQTTSAVWTKTEVPSAEQHASKSK